MAFVKAKRDKVDLKVYYTGSSGAGKSFSELKREFERLIERGEKENRET